MTWPAELRAWSVLAAVQGVAGVTSLAADGRMELVVLALLLALTRALGFGA